jgi:quercetin dioxygenase-like cupin family protein
LAACGFRIEKLKLSGSIKIADFKVTRLGRHGQARRGVRVLILVFYFGKGDSMKRTIALCGIFGIGILVGGVSSDHLRAQGPQYVTKPVLRTDLNNLPGQEVLIFASTWQPGFALPLHMHPNGHEITFVIEGEQTFEIDGLGTKVVKAGEALYTPPNTPHFGCNATDKVSKTLVVRIKDKDKPIMVEVKR